MIAAKFCTWYDSCAVVAYAKLGSKTIAMGLPWNEIAVEDVLMKWGPPPYIPMTNLQMNTCRQTNQEMDNVQLKTGNIKIVKNTRIRKISRDPIFMWNPGDFISFAE